MNLEKLKLEAALYSDAIQKTTNLIDEYIDLYNEYDSLYLQKWSYWVKNTRNEYIKIYKDLEFTLSNNRNNYDLGYGDKTTIYEIATFKTLEFELMLGLDEEIYTTIRFLQTKPNSSKLNIEINPNIKKYENNIDLNRSKDGIILSQYSFYKSIDKLLEVKNSIIEMNFKLEGIEEAYIIIKNKMDELSSALNELKNNNIIGKVEINKEKIVVESLSKLLEIL